MIEMIFVFLLIVIVGGFLVTLALKKWGTYND